MWCASILSVALALTCSASAIPNPGTIPTSSSSYLDPASETSQTTASTPSATPTPTTTTAPELTPDTFDETIKSGYWFVKHYASWCPYSIRAAPGWAAAHAAYTNSTVPGGGGGAASFTDFYDFHFASVECSTRGVCDRPELMVDGYPTFNLYKDGVFIAQMLDDAERVLSGFALFVEEFLDEKFPGTRVGGVELGGGGGGGDGESDAEGEEERLESIEAIWRANREKGAVVDVDVPVDVDVDVDVPVDVDVDVPVDVGTTGRPKSSAIGRLHLVVDGIRSIAQEWYVQQVPGGSWGV